MNIICVIAGIFLNARFLNECHTVFDIKEFYIFSPFEKLAIIEHELIM